MHQLNLAPERVQDGGQLDADVTPAKHDAAPRQLRPLEKLVARIGEMRPLHLALREVLRVTARRDEHVLALEEANLACFVVLHLNRALVVYETSGAERRVNLRVR